MNLKLLPAIVTSKKELQQILALQQKNLRQNVSPEEMNLQGFVTMKHSPEILEHFHDLAPSVIIKDGENVIAYALVMLKECRLFYKPLEPMFQMIDQMAWNEKALSSYHYYAMGQVCVAKEYRGKGVFEMLYRHHKKIYQPQFDCIVTEISTTNYRSLNAHKKTGFETIHTYRDETDEWDIVLWDWK